MESVHEGSQFSLSDLTRILDELKDGIIITDKDGIILWGNRYYSEIAKFDIRTYYGKNVRAISQRENVQLPEGSKTLFDQAFRSKKEVHELVKYNTDDYVITSITPIYDDQGEIRYFLYLVTNYSETMRLQKEISLANTKTKALEEHLQELQFHKLLGDDIIVKNREMKRIFQMGAKLADTTASVMILGESGVGKDVLAKFIHNNGSRRDAPFIHVNLGAIPKGLFESQLFGYAPGAFTGASKTGKIGLIQLANGGTLFLDEVGELSIDIQAKLLQVLQDKAVRPVGSSEMIPVDVRILSATNRNLAEMVQNREFRLDLYYRLNVIELKIPPLRKRTEDIPFLVSRFIREFNERYGTHKEISPEALELFYNYFWPGNIRELRHMVESLVALGQEQIITPSHLPGDFQLKQIMKQVEATSYEDSGLKTIVAHLEKRVIKEALAKYPSAIEAAAYLKIDSSTLSKKRKKYGI